MRSLEVETSLSCRDVTWVQWRFCFCKIRFPVLYLYWTLEAYWDFAFRSSIQLGGNPVQARKFLIFVNEKMFPGVFCRLVPPASSSFRCFQGPVLYCSHRGRGTYPPILPPSTQRAPKLRDEILEYQEPKGARVVTESKFTILSWSSEREEGLPWAAQQEKGKARPELWSSCLRPCPSYCCLWQPARLIYFVRTQDL